MFIADYQTNNKTYRSMITTDKVIEIFCIADDFCKEYEKEIQNHQLQAGNVSKKETAKQGCLKVKS